MSKTIIKAYTDKAGPSVSLSGVSADDLDIRQELQRDKTLATGYSSVHPDLTVPSGLTYTLSSGATLVVDGDLIVTGTLVDNGGKLINRS